MGTPLCLLSAAAFGLLAVFGRLALEDGVDLNTLLFARFGIAAVLLLPLALRRGLLERLTPRLVAIGLGMGAVGYALQATLYFAALQHTEVSQVALVFSCYPLLVTVVAVLTRRERGDARRWVAIALSWFGIGLVVTGGSVGSFALLGAGLALAAAAVYCVYITVGDRINSLFDPVDLTTLVVTGAAGTFLASGLLHGGPHLRLSAMAWMWLVLVGSVSTVAAILMFFAGMARVGPATASLLGTLEPVVTVLSAALVFGERLTPLQLGGALMVLGALVVCRPRAGAGKQRDLPVLVLEPATTAQAGMR